MVAKAMVTINEDGTYSLSSVIRSDINGIFSSEQLSMALDLFGEGIAGV